MEKRLYRSTQNKVLAGVCGGIGEYFGVDPVLVRLLVVVFTLMWGAGLIAYIIAALIIPSRNSDDLSEAYQQTYGNRESGEGQGSNYGYSPETNDQNNRNTVWVLGLILMGAGGLIALRYFIPWIPMKLIFAAILLIIGILLILKRK
ncbi:MAG: PspC domain-containing protein [Bacillota bacterium]|jgi:phage shock protein C|nr:PspC domain-containing protein [Bacillota bacterium]NLM07426.1 PspC domain-containing protein [Clostridiales Family XIII bacterium]